MPKCLQAVTVKERSYLDSIATEPVYSIGIKEYTYNECTSREINLGLDLKGGMNVTLEVSVVDVILCQIIVKMKHLLQQLNLCKRKTKK